LNPNVFINQTMLGNDKTMLLEHFLGSILIDGKCCTCWHGSIEGKPHLNQALL
jgi:hypothetical protein